MTAAGKHRAVKQPALRKEVVLAALDMGAAFASIWLALWLRFGAGIPAPHLIPYCTYFPVLVAWRVLVAQCFGLYDFRYRLTAADHAFAGVGAAVAGVVPGYLLLAVVQLYYAPATHLSRLVAGLDLCLLAVWFVVSRAAVLAWLRRAGYRVRALVVGPADNGRALAEGMREHAPKLLEVAGVAASDEGEGGDILGKASGLEGVLGRECIDWVVLTAQDMPQRQLRDILFQCDQAGVDVFVHPGLSLAALANARVVSMAGLPLVSLSPGFARTPYQTGKRVLDLAAALGVLVAGSPLWVAVALGIKLGSKGPLFFVQERLGLRGRQFRIIKFRTMAADAEADSGPVLASGDDPRVTRFGRLLRRFRVDEAPQLWNVLRGEMSLVGPRPERAEFAQRFIEENPLYERRFLVKPGLTGLAQVHGRYDTDYTQKLRYDLIYINSVSFALDLRILLATIRTVLTGRGAV